MKVLITGASGFVGSHLAEYLLTQDKYEIFGTHFGSSNEYLESILPAANVLPVNLMSKEQVRSIVDKIEPDWVFHLAALSSAAASYQDPGGTITNNVEAQVNLLEALIKMKKMPRTLIVGSAEEYGLVEDVESIDENTSLNPTSPYAVSKIAQDFLGLQYYLSYKLPVVRVRPFNHIGERRPEIFVEASFAKQIAELENDPNVKEIMVGNLSAIRDFTDVKDMVKAYELALIKGESGEVYNLGSGRGISIQELVDKLVGLSKKKIAIRIDESRLRPIDVERLVCDHSKFSHLTGWKPVIPLEKTLERVLDYWREQVVSSK